MEFVDPTGLFSYDGSGQQKSTYSASSGENPSKTLEKSLLANYNVRNPDVIMNKAFEMTGHSELTATAGYNIGDFPRHCEEHSDLAILSVDCFIMFVMTEGFVWNFINIQSRF